MIKITGFNQLSRQLEDAEKALEDLDGQLTTVSFHPNDPESIEAAIQQVDTIIDEKVGRYTHNSIIGPLIEEMKAKCRETIIEKAVTERVKGDDSDG